jgi:hypothetical protein
VFGQDFIRGEVEDAGELLLADDFKGRGEAGVDGVLLQQLAAHAVDRADETRRQLLGGEPQRGGGSAVVGQVCLLKETPRNPFPQFASGLLGEGGGHDGSRRQTGGNLIDNLARKRESLSGAGTRRHHGDIVQQVHE